MSTGIGTVAATTVGSGGSGSAGTGGAGGGGGAAGAGGAIDDAGTDAAPPPAHARAHAQAGLLTAGAWDDNRNFDWFAAYRAALTSRSLDGILPLSDGDFDTSHQMASTRSAPGPQLDISLVIDTTGSMGDELSYLQTEFLAISSAIETKYPNASTRWGLVLYRDVGDEYVTRSFDFTSDAHLFQANLAAQRADGGGDYPESPERGLGDMTKLAWAQGSTSTKLAFWVADAPHHAQNAPTMATVLLQIRSLGIHVYPVASSGVDEITELTMRSAAELTLGRYIFLTNDSGIGDPHKEPSIPCYFVTKLDSAILRVVDIEMSGVYREPLPAEIIRTGGNPQNGACTLGSGKVLQVF
jgi:hypothetical protein